MKTIKISASTEYEVRIGAGLLHEAGKAAKAVAADARRVMIVSDDIVFPLYGKTCRDALESAGFECFVFCFENGEQKKRLSTVENILEQLAAAHFCRSDLIVALGGGVVGDMAGFAAAIFLRGIRCIQLPTTLLAAVDSSVGGKTAVDLSIGKNLCGAFHQPSLVLCDTDTLQTLLPLNTADGLAEMLKYGVICDEHLFEAVANHTSADIESLIARCVEIKRDIVANDEFDRGMRKLLNLGHTVGHAIEAASKYTITHGHAVAAGMAIVARAAEQNGYAKSGTAKRIEKVLTDCSLPTNCVFDAPTLSEYARGDKKIEGGQIDMILPKQIGESVIYPMQVIDLEAFIALGL